MSVSGQTKEECVAEEMGAPERDLYDQKAVSTVVRVLTVLAYLLSVSLAAILLSVYYVCVWKSSELPLLNDTLEASARQADPSHHYEYSPDTYRGGNTTVNENSTQQTLGPITDDGFWIGNDTGKFAQLTNFSEEFDANSEISVNVTPSAEDVLNITGPIT